MSAQLVAPWDGVNVPQGQQCGKFGGAGATPPVKVAGLPFGTTEVHLEFNDLTYKPLSKDGGHGVIGFAVTAPVVMLPSVPAMTANLDAPAFVVVKARSGGDFASDGYLPPCSGGRGNHYSVTIKALDASGETLESLVLPLGQY